MPEFDDLTAETEEKARRAMSSIMKHRGGGPFGLGRLPPEELPDFETSVVDLVDALREDSLQQDEPEASLAAYAARQPGENMPFDPEGKATGIREEDEDAVLMVVKSDTKEGSVNLPGASYMQQLAAARAARGSKKHR